MAARANASPTRSCRKWRALSARRDPRRTPGRRGGWRRVRVTYLMRCLAMMRGGGETQHLSWMRALRDMGVEVDIISGRPLLQAPPYRVADLRETMLLSPYTRDLVYKVQ